jgi:hypothetical protein
MYACCGMEWHLWYMIIVFWRCIKIRAEEVKFLFNAAMDFYFYFVIFLGAWILHLFFPYFYLFRICCHNFGLCFKIIKWLKWTKWWCLLLFSFFLFFRMETWFWMVIYFSLKVLPENDSLSQISCLWVFLVFFFFLKKDHKYSGSTPPHPTIFFPIDSQKL